MGENSLAALFLHLIHPPTGASVCSQSQKRIEPQYVRTTKSVGNLESVCLPTCEMKTVVDGSHSDNTVGAVLLSAKDAEFF